MEEIYHFSHFFEFFCGVYFGGFALLGFIEDKAFDRFQALVKYRKDKAVRSKLLAEEHFKFKTNLSSNSNPFIILWNAVIWCLVILVASIGTLFFHIANYFITKIGTNSEKLFLKKFFPSFFFAGCFCLALILLTAFQNINKIHNCYEAINHFIIYYALSTIIFHIWALFIFPFLVNRFSYEHLILASLTICGLLIRYSLYHSTDTNLFFDLNWTLEKVNREKLSLLLVFVSSIPLFFILLFSLVTLIAWGISTVLYTCSIFVFYNDNEVLKAIDEIT